MKTPDELRELGKECFEQMKELNPVGGIREYIRMAVEFGYKRAIKDFKKEES